MQNNKIDVVKCFFYKLQCYNRNCKCMTNVFAPYLATCQIVLPVTSNPVILGKSIKSDRFLNHQNLSIILDSIDWVGWCNNSGGGG